MSYIGVQSQNQVSPAFHREVVTPDGSASFFDLVQDVPGYNADNVLVVVNNVVQHPFDSYTIKADANGNPRRLDFAGTVPAATDVIYVTHRGVGTLNITPAAGTVTSVSLSDNLRSGNVDSFAGSAHSVVSSNSTFTLSEIPLNSQSISVFVNGVYQKPTTNYSVTGSSAVLTFVGQVVSTDEIDVHHHTIRTGVTHVADGSVTSAKLDTGSVTSAKLDTNITIAGNLTVNGTQTTINTATLEIEDKDITIAKVASPTDSTAADAGIIIKGTTDKTLQWKSATNSLSSNVKLAENAGSSAFHRPLTTMLALG